MRTQLHAKDEQQSLLQEQLEAQHNDVANIITALTAQHESDMAQLEKMKREVLPVVRTARECGMNG